MRILIAIMLLAGTISCDTWESKKRVIQLNACEEGFRFISAERFEAITNPPFPLDHDLDQFEYGEYITGNYYNDLSKGFQGGRDQMSIFLALTNNGEEGIPLVVT